MKNVKDEVYAALASIPDTDVSDLYPASWAAKYSIQYQEEQNAVFEKTDDKEQICQLRYIIYAWSDSSLSQLAVDIDARMAKLGLVRTLCQDANDPSHKRHKVMRYEGLMDVNTDHVYWNGNQ